MNNTEEILRKQRMYYYITFLLLVLSICLSICAAGLATVLVVICQDWLSIIIILMAGAMAILSFFIKPVTFLTISALSCATMAMALYYIVYVVVYLCFAETINLLYAFLEVGLSLICIIQFFVVFGIAKVLKTSEQVIFPNQPDFNHPVPMLEPIQNSSSRTDERYLLIGQLIGIISDQKFDVIETQNQIDLGARDTRKHPQVQASPPPEAQST